MKLRLFFAQVLMLSCFNSAAQCPEGSLSISDQDDVDEFLVNFPDCTELEHLYVTLNNAEGQTFSFAGMENIETISGIFSVIGAGQPGYCQDGICVSFDGLESLSYVENFQIQLANVCDFNGLSSLVHIENFTLWALLTDENDEYTPQCDISFSGLQALETVNQMYFTGYNFNSFEQMSSLESIEDLSFDICGGFSDLSFLESIEIGELGLSIINDLNSLLGLQDLISLQGELYLYDLPNLTSLDALSNLQYIGTDFSIQGTSVESLGALANINHIGGSVSIVDNPSLSVCDFPYLCNHIEIVDTIGGNLEGCNTLDDLIENCGASSVQGQLLVDMNCDGIQNGLDIYLENNWIFRNEGEPMVTTDNEGSYSGFLGENQDFEISAAVFPGYSSSTVLITTSEVIEEYTDANLFLCPQGEFENWRVSISEVGGPPKPGFVNAYQVCVMNLGTSSSNSELVMDLSDMPGATVFESDGGNVIGSEIHWDLNDQSPFQSACFEVQVLVDPETPLGTTYNAHAEFIALSDIDTTDNVHFWEQTVVGSFDPNDKLVSAEAILVESLGQNGMTQLEYLIRFQNTGTAPATFINVIDLLPPELDASSLKMINASHDYVLSFEEPNKLDWYFEDINLPDSTSNEPESHGFIHFEINTVENMQAGDSIENYASIYFDYNEPIVTESAVTAFMDCSEGSLMIESPELICEGEPFVVSSSLSDFDQYEWMINGQEFSGEEVQYSTFLEEEVNIQLTATNAVCTLSTEAQMPVTPQPYVAVIPEGFTVCGVGEELELGSVGSVSWYLDDELVATGDPVVLDESGVYYLTSENECGLVDITVGVQIVDLPEEVNLTFDGDQLIVEPEGSEHYWFFEGSMITIAGPEYTPTEPGNYSVNVFFEGSWCSLSSNMVFVPVSVNEQLEAQISLYPNPAKDVVIIELPKGLWQLNLTDAAGRQLRSFSDVSETQFEMELKGLTPGVYYVQIQSDEGLVVKKLVVE